jgi:general secretion pathway protein G
MMIRSQFVSGVRCQVSGVGCRVSGTRNPEPGAGFTLIELVAAMTILLLLTAVALPMGRMQVQRARAEELRRDLRDLRQAIDRYKDFADRGMIPMKFESYGYPPDLDTLVKGVELKGPSNKTYKFLRRIPVDPMTGKAEWGMRSMQDDPDSKSWGGENVFDVYTLGTGKALDGTDYSDW